MPPGWSRTDKAAAICRLCLSNNLLILVILALCSPRYDLRHTQPLGAQLGYNSTSCFSWSRLRRDARRGAGQRRLNLKQRSLEHFDAPDQSHAARRHRRTRLQPRCRCYCCRRALLCLCFPHRRRPRRWNYMLLPHCCIERPYGLRPPGVASAGDGALCLRGHSHNLIAQLLHLRLHMAVRDRHGMQLRAVWLVCDAPLCRLQTALDRLNHSAQLRAELPQRPQREARLDQ